MRAQFIGILLVLWTALPAVAQDAPRLTVSGSGTAEAAPDMAVVSVGVQATESDAEAAMTAVSQKMSALLQAVSEAGVAQADVQTTGLSLSPEYRYRNDGSEPPAISAYTATNGVTLRVRDLDNLGGLLGQLVGEGANRLNGLSFDVADPAPLVADARRKAVADARAAAEVLAEAAGVSLGSIISITDGGAPAQPGPMMRMEAAVSSADVPVAEGSVGRTSRVTVVWALGD